MDSFSLADRFRSLTACLCLCLPCRPAHALSPSPSADNLGFFPDPTRERLLSDDFDDANGGYQRRREVDLMSLRSDFGRRRGEDRGGFSRWGLAKAWFASWTDKARAVEAPGAIYMDEAEEDELLEADSSVLTAPAEADARELESVDVDLAAIAGAAGARTSQSSPTATKNTEDPSVPSDAALAAEEAALAAAQEAAERRARRKARRKVRELGLQSGSSQAGSSEARSSESLAAPQEGGRRRRRKHRDRAVDGDGSSQASSSRASSLPTPSSPTVDLAPTTSRKSKAKSKGSSRSRSTVSSSSRSPLSPTETAATSRSGPSAGSRWDPQLAPASVPQYVPEAVDAYYAYCSAYREQFGRDLNEAGQAWVWEQFACGSGQPTNTVGFGEDDSAPTSTERQHEAGEPPRGVGWGSALAQVGLPPDSSTAFLQALKATKRPPPPPSPPSAARPAPGAAAEPAGAEHARQSSDEGFLTSLVHGARAGSTARKGAWEGASEVAWGEWKDGGVDDFGDDDGSDDA